MGVTGCPGLYCGRTLLSDGVWSACGACPRGFRANLTGQCSPCDGEPVLYDWTYLGFMALLPLVLHWFFIDSVTKRGREALALHFYALIEVITACAAALLLAHPAGELGFRSCRVSSLSDWYTPLHNPTPDYATVLHCAQEAVYPLYTAVLMAYALCVPLMAVTRGLLLPLIVKPPRHGVRLATYRALYFLPALVAVHAVAAGLLYYSYPYAVVVLSVTSSASHLALQRNQSMKGLLLSSVADARNALVLLGHWLLHAYGIISVTGLKDPIFHGSLLLLVPAPAAFYVLTARFTDPSKVHGD